MGANLGSVTSRSSLDFSRSRASRSSRRIWPNRGEAESNTSARSLMARVMAATISGDGNSPWAMAFSSGKVCSSFSKLRRRSRAEIRVSLISSRSPGSSTAPRAAAPTRGRTSRAPPMESSGRSSSKRRASLVAAGRRRASARSAVGLSECARSREAEKAARAASPASTLGSSRASRSFESMMRQFNTDCWGDGSEQRQAVLQGGVAELGQQLLLHARGVGDVGGHADADEVAGQRRGGSEDDGEELDGQRGGEEGPLRQPQRTGIAPAVGGRIQKLLP